MRENATDSKPTGVEKWFEIHRIGRQHEASRIQSGFALDSLLQSIEIEEIDGDEFESFSLKLKATDREIKQPQRLRCKSSIALIPSQTLRFPRKACRLYAGRGIEQNIYRTPMRTPWQIHLLKNPQGHGNTKSEGIANASKECRPKYIGSRWTGCEHNSSRRHIA